MIDSRAQRYPNPTAEPRRTAAATRAVAALPRSTGFLSGFPLPDSENSPRKVPYICMGVATPHFSAPQSPPFWECSPHLDPALLNGASNRSTAVLLKHGCCSTDWVDLYGLSKKGLGGGARPVPCRLCCAVPQGQGGLFEAFALQQVRQELFRCGAELSGCSSCWPRRVLAAGDIDWWEWYARRGGRFVI